MEDLRTRTALRRQLRAARDRIDPAERRMRSRCVCDQLHSALTQLAPMPRTVALYRALGSELVLDDLVEDLATCVRLAAPVTLKDGQLAFVEVQSTELMAASQSTVPAFLTRPWEPQEGVPEGRRLVPAREIDLFVVPGLGFDLKGGRLGYGGGYYDRYLAHAPGLRWGACFEEQLCVDGQIPRAAHDIAMDRVFAG